MFDRKEASLHVVSIDQRIIAVIDVLLVFAGTISLIWLAMRLPISPVARNFLAYTHMIAVPLLVLLLIRRDLRAYGLNFQRLRDQLGVGACPFGAAIWDAAHEKPTICTGCGYCVDYCAYDVTQAEGIARCAGGGCLCWQVTPSIGS